MKLVDKKTGAVVDVPDDKAQAAFMSGQYGVPKGAAMPVRQPGLSGVVDAKDAATALREGMTPSTEEQFRKAQTEARYGGFGGGVEAAGVGAARGAASAFGVPLDAVALDAADMVSGGEDEVDPYRGARHLSGADMLRERLRGLQEAHPFASQAGELGGFAAGAALGGGLPGAAETTLGAVGRGVIEGGGIGLVGGINEAALGDENVTASKIMASVGHGALIGGALGGGLHLGGEALAGARDRAGRWLSTMKPESVDALAREHFGYAPEGLGQRVQQGYARLSSAASGKDFDTISKFTELSPEGAEARRIGVFDAPEIQANAEREVRKHVDDILASGDFVSAEARGGLKADYVRRAVKTGNEGEVTTFAAQKLQRLIEGAEEQLGQEMAPTMMKSVESVSKLAYRAQEALAKGDNAEAFIALDNVKRGVQRLTSNGYRSIRLIADPVDALNARRTVTWLDGAASDLRSGLEDSDVWGKAADDQRAINGAWTRQIDASKRFHRALTTEIGRDPNNPYLDVRGADPAKVSSYVKNLTNPNNDLTHKAVLDFVGSTRDLSTAIRDSYELPPEKLAEVERVHGAADSFGKSIDKAENALVTANQYQRLLEAPEGGSFAGALGTVGGIAGGLPGGILGTVAGATLGAVQNPGKMVAKLAALERLSSKVDHELTNGVRSFLSGAKAPKELPGSVEMLKGEKTERASFESKVNEVRRLAGNPDELTGRIREFTSQFDDAAPGVAKALTYAAVKGLQYLAQTAPPGFQPRPEALAWGIDEPPLYTDAEMREWSRRAAVVNDPMAAVKSMKRKMLTPEEADALKVVHQPIYQALQREFLVQRSEPKRSSMTYGQKLQIELMFDVPLNRTLDPAFMHVVQQSFSVAEPHHRPPPSGAQPSRMARSQAGVADSIRGGY